jgi:hypothetical protein
MQCLPVLQVLKDLINTQHTIIHSHRLLSILKLAAVEDNIPRINAAMSTQSPLSPSSLNPYILSVLVLILNGTLAQILLILAATMSVTRRRTPRVVMRADGGDDDNDDNVRDDDAPAEHIANNTSSEPKSAMAFFSHPSSSSLIIGNNEVVVGVVDKDPFMSQCTSRSSLLLHDSRVRTREGLRPRL